MKARVHLQPFQLGRIQYRLEVNLPPKKQNFLATTIGGTHTCHRPCAASKIPSGSVVSWFILRSLKSFIGNSTQEIGGREDKQTCRWARKTTKPGSNSCSAVRTFRERGLCRLVYTPTSMGAGLTKPATCTEDGFVLLLCIHIDVRSSGLLHPFRRIRSYESRVW